MNFNPDPFKQVQEVLSSRKNKSQNHPCFHFNNSPVNQTLLQKHLQMYLDPRLDFLEHLKTFRPKRTNQLLYYRNSKLLSQDQHY